MLYQVLKCDKMLKSECQKANGKHVAYYRKGALSAILSVSSMGTNKGCHNV